MLHDGGHLRAAVLYLADESFYRAVTMTEVVIIFEVLPDAPGTQSFGYYCFGDMAVRFARALAAFAVGLGGRFGRFWVPANT